MSPSGRPRELPITIEELGELLNPLVEMRTDSECWIWTGPHNPNGAPRVLLHFKHRRASYSTSVSRLMYQYIYDRPEVKDLPRFQFCPKNRSCVNPAHTVFAPNQNRSLGDRCGRNHKLTPQSTTRTDDGRLICLTCRGNSYGKNSEPQPDWEGKAREIVATTWGEDRALPDLSARPPDPETEQTHRKQSEAGKARWAERSTEYRRAHSQKMLDARYTEHIDDAHFDRIMAQLLNWGARWPVKVRCDREEAQRVRDRVRHALGKEDFRLRSSYDPEKQILFLTPQIKEGEKTHMPE